MKKKDIIKIMTSAGFLLEGEEDKDLTFRKSYKCGARVSCFHSPTDDEIVLNWTVNRSSSFEYPKDFPMVNKFHYHKGTTFHRFEDFAASLATVEETYKIA